MSPTTRLARCLAVLLLLTAGIATAAQRATTTTTETRFIDVGEHRFAYRELGPRGGLPLVLLNRLRGTMDHWDPLFVDALAQQRHVIVFDHAGLARSGGPVPQSYAAFAATGADFLLALGHPQVDVLGFSFGGTVAQQLALDRPGQVRRLVIAGSSPGFVPGDDAINNGPPPAKVWETAFKPENTDADFLYLFFGASETSQAAGRAYLARLGARADAFSVQVSAEGWQGQIAAAQAIGGTDTTLLHRLPELRQRTLVANGNNDIMTPTYASYAMFQTIPDARLLLYPDSGHGFLFQYAEEFAREVLDFLDAP